MDRVKRVCLGLSRKQLLRQRNQAVLSSINEVIIDAIGNELVNQDVEGASQSFHNAEHSLRELSGREYDLDPNVDDVGNSVSDGDLQIDDEMAGCSAERATSTAVPEYSTIQNFGFDDDVVLVYDSDSDEERGVDVDKPCLTTFLRGWAIENNVKKSIVTKLLKGLHTWHDELPLDARTLLKTPRDVPITEMGNGKYCNFGVETTILKCLKDFSLQEHDRITLQFNIDGLPLFKSSSIQFWPILCRIEQAKVRKPFAVAIFCGSSKPPVEDFLHDFVIELANLRENGLLIQGKLVSVEVSLFCCDTPAKAFLKCTKSFNGFSGCDNCTQRGEYKGRLVYPEINAPLRTDVAFDEMADAEHHKKKSPLAGLGIGLVSTFPLDYMHLVCLGVMRRLLVAWTDRSSPQRLPLKSINVLSSSLLNAQEHWPTEFSRKPRSLSELDRWKATEFRQFVLYLGPVYLKDILSKNLYDHFMLFSCAISILVSKNLFMSCNTEANTLLRLFVSQAKNMYGIQFLVYNVHNLVHLSSHALRFGPLDAFSAFPFENYLGSLKRMLKKTSAPLQQVVNRIKERELCGQRFITTDNLNEEIFSVVESSKLPRANWPADSMDGAIYYGKVSGPLFRLSAHTRDCGVLLINGAVLKVCSFYKDFGDNIFVVGHLFCIKADFFIYPCKSSELSIFKVKSLSNNYHCYPIANIASKCLLLPQKDYFVCLPFRHSE
jgi:hypothetical protein